MLSHKQFGEMEKESDYIDMNGYVIWNYLLSLILLLTHQLLSLIDSYCCGLKFYVYFRVWYDEPNGDRGAVGRGWPQRQVTL